jgi:hypothetical protein
MREIMDVPLPRASCRLLISFFTFHISTFLSETVSSLILWPFPRDEAVKRDERGKFYRDVGPEPLRDSLGCCIIMCQSGVTYL